MTTPLPLPNLVVRRAYHIRPSGFGFIMHCWICHTELHTSAPKEECEVRGTEEIERHALEEGIEGFPYRYLVEMPDSDDYAVMRAHVPLSVLKTEGTTLGLRLNRDEDWRWCFFGAMPKDITELPNLTNA